MTVLHFLERPLMVDLLNMFDVGALFEDLLSLFLLFIGFYFANPCKSFVLISCVFQNKDMD